MAQSSDISKTMAEGRNAVDGGAKALPWATLERMRVQALGKAD